MTIDETLEYLKSAKRQNDMVGILPGSDIGNTIIKALEELKQYHAIGTPEELKTAMQYVRLAKAHGTVGQVIEKCAEYEEIGTVEECRAAMEKQTTIPREIIEGKYFCPKCHNLMPYPGYCGCGQRLY